VVANRHEDRAQRLLEAVSARNQGTATSTATLEDRGVANALRTATVVVNATSVGLASSEMPIDPSPIPPGALLVDVIYNPRETALLRAARGRGVRVLGGLGMLVYQAAAAFEAWTGAQPPIEVMREAAEDALEGVT
jgi:shikimate dehydrogenase